MRPFRSLVFVALVFVPSVASPQGNPVGPEFRVNTFITSYQFAPAVASDPSGHFVVVWTSRDQDGSNDGVFGQRYANTGAPLGPEFRVNTYTTNQQQYPAVASDGFGNFVVVWHSFQNGSNDVFGQRYASTGAPLGPEFRVNTFTPNGQQRAAVAADAAGNFVVVWMSANPNFPGFEVFGQRYASTGVPLGIEFHVNTYTPYSQSTPRVAAGPTGNFVVVWQSNAQDGSNYGVFGQRYASTGAPAGAEFRVNTYTSSFQFVPAVASDGAGRFVVVWMSEQDGQYFGVFGQRYASTGAPLSPEFRVNTFTTDSQGPAAVASDAAGNFVVVWRSRYEDGSNDGVFGQRYANTGAPLGPEFRVNTHTTANQRYPSVTADSGGNFVVVWTSSNQDGAADGVFGQRYNMIVPVELTHFTVE